MSQTEQLITEHLDIWTAAIENKGTSGRGSNRKQSLYGIKKLRELILELAVRGLLVPQNPNDEPASVLLEKIAAEKDRLVEEGKIKKQKPLPRIKEEENPFKLPKGWSWIRLGDAGLVASSSRVQKKDWQNTGVPFYRAREIVQLSRNSHVDNELFIRDSLFEELSRNGISPQANDIMITGVGTIGVPYVVSQNDRFYFKDASVLIFKNYFNLNSDYLSCFMLSPFWIHSVHDGSMGTTVHTLTIVRANNILVPFPPEAEQPRIVVKVNELMALCDQLEQQTEASLDAHQTLVETLLKALLEAAQSRHDASAFEKAWQRIADHFDVLFTTEHSIDQLKQTILQLAVMGKLVPQDPNDEPASVLLEKIAAEKERLVKEGKIKKQKPLPPISEEEKLFELPAGWECERINTISIVGTGATPARDNPSYYTPAEFNWVTSGETSQAYIAETKEKVSSKAVAETNVTIYPPGTLVIAMYGQGKTRGQITELLIPAGTNQACAAMQLVNETDYHRAYIKLYFQKAYEDIRSIAEGGAQPNLNVGKVSKTVIPLPPIQEQQRIVEKVHALIAICDSLIANIKESQTTQLHLANAMAEQALN